MNKFLIKIYKSIFGKMINGFVLHKIVLDKSGKPIDYIFLKMNKQFENFTGIKRENIGKKVTEVIPDIVNSKFNWIEFYGDIALNNKKASIEQYVGEINKWYLINAYSLKRGYFAVIIEDITKKKSAEIIIEKQNKKLEVMNNIISLMNKCCDLNKLFDELFVVLQKIFNYESYGAYLIENDIAKIFAYKNLSEEFLESVDNINIYTEPFKNILVDGNLSIKTEKLSEIMNQIHHKSFCSIPLIAENKVIGALNLSTKTEFVMSQDESDLLYSIGKEIGAAVQKIKNQEKIKQNELNFETVFNSISDFVVISDVNSNILEANNVFIEKSGYSKEELLKMNILDTVPKEFHEEIINSSKEKFSNNTSIILSKIKTKNNTIIDVEVKTTVTVWNNQKVLLGIGRDVTDKNKLEKKEKQYKNDLLFLNNLLLELSAISNIDDIYQKVVNKLSLLVENSVILINIYDKNLHELKTKAVYMNENYKNIFKNILNINLLDGCYKLNDENYKYLTNGKINYFPNLYELALHSIPKPICIKLEKTFNTKQFFSVGLVNNNEVIGDFVIISCEKEIDLNVDLIETYAREISVVLQRTNAEQEKHESTEIFKKLVLASPDAILLVDLNGNILFASPRTYEIFNYSENIIGSSIFKWIVKEQHQTIHTKIHQLLTNPSYKPTDNEYLFIKEDNTFLDVEINTSLIKDSKGKPLYLVSVIRDITKRKQVEKILKEAKDKAEESDKLKTAFLANMSHEIRTPVNGIIGFIDLLKDETITPAERKEFMDIIVNSSNNLLTIINDIVDISKIESNQVKIIKSSIYLNDFMKKIYSFFNQELQKIKPHIKFNLKMPSNNNIFLGDELRIKQILTNLINNSVKFTQKGFIEIGYDITESYVDFYVKDSGIGIKKEDHSLIFERFRQVDDSATRKYGGLGIGLSISKHLVKLMGGEIFVDSTPEIGSNFYFRLKK